jgi:nicotinamidase-related amidase
MNYDIDLKDIEVYNTHKRQLNTKQAALLVIEMQETFRTDMGLISKKQIYNVQELIKFAEIHSMPIIVVRHNDSSANSENMITWWGDKLEMGAPNWEIIPEIDCTGKTIIDKSQYSSFYQTDLDAILKRNNISDLIICGLMTNCCCETAARDAFMRGYHVFFINDATATINQDLHLAAIKNIAFGFGTVLNTVNLLS